VTVRIVARLDVKAPHLIKGVQLEGLRIVGDPGERARKYYRDGVDEIIYMDVVASLYGRNNLTEIVRHTVREVFVPITVGGGVRTLDDARELLRAGADRVAVNTAAVKRPELIAELARRFGTQCVVLSIEAKRRGDRWEVFTDNGREPTGLDVVEWSRRGAQLGAGEVLVTSVDREGTREGFDVEAVAAVASAVDVPVVASGGMGSLDHFDAVVTRGGASAVAVADALHFDRLSVAQIRQHALASGFRVRQP
jgi:imidazole glycerol-phosphate synthase subunit HisF